MFGLVVMSLYPLSVSGGSGGRFTSSLSPLLDSGSVFVLGVSSVGMGLRGASVSLDSASVFVLVTGSWPGLPASSAISLSPSIYGFGHYGATLNRLLSRLTAITAGDALRYVSPATPGP